MFIKKITLHSSWYVVDALNEGSMKQTKFVLPGYLVMHQSGIIHCKQKSNIMGKVFCLLEKNQISSFRNSPESDS